MHSDRDYGQQTSDGHIPGSGADLQPSTTPDSQLPRASGIHALIINEPVTRDSLIEKHKLDPNDPEVSSLLDRILDLRDAARIKGFLPVIAARHIAAFRSRRQDGTNPQQEPQNP